jgi:hypothetical protein
MTTAQQAISDPPRGVVKFGYVLPFAIQAAYVRVYAASREVTVKSSMKSNQNEEPVDDYDHESWQYSRGPIHDGLAFYYRDRNRYTDFKGGKLQPTNPMECVTCDLPP